MKKRVSFLIDGFNAYNSICVAASELNNNSIKWLNYRSLCNAYISQFGADANLESIFWFSAIPSYLLHKNPEKVRRHENYIKALKSENIDIVLGKFKPVHRSFWYKHKKITVKRHEEKETDVAIAVKIFELLIKNLCDVIIIVSGDTDLIPAIKTAKEIYTSKEICVLFPYFRYNRELQDCVNRHFMIKRKSYLKHCFPDIIILPDGNKINKPVLW